MRRNRSSLRNNGVHFSPRELTRILSALLSGRKPSHQRLAAKMLNGTPLGRQLQLILRLERKKQTAAEIQSMIGSSRRTVFRYLVRLEELGVKVGIEHSLYTIVSMEPDVRELVKQLGRGSSRLIKG